VFIDAPIDTERDVSAAAKTEIGDDEDVIVDSK
jgi:hypothetical protein